MPAVGDVAKDGQLVWLKKQCFFHALQPYKPLPHPSGCVCTGGWYPTGIQMNKTPDREG